MKVLPNCESVIKALGGGVALTKLVGVKTPHAPTNWKSRGRFPARLYTTMIRALADRGMSAPSSLWGQGNHP